MINVSLCKVHCIVVEVVVYDSTFLQAVIMLTYLLPLCIYFFSFNKLSNLKLCEVPSDTNVFNFSQCNDKS